MGAHFTQSLLHYLWEQDGVEFKPDHRIKIANSEHDNTVGTRANIYCFAEHPWSKYARDKIALDGDTFHYLKPIISKLFADRQYLIVANTDIEDAYLLEHFPQGIRIPNMPHGLNKYRHINDIVFLSALNNAPTRPPWRLWWRHCAPLAWRCFRTNPISRTSIRSMI